MKVYIETYGCTANQSDSQWMKGILLQNDHEITNSVKDADIVILNTCTVTERTDRQMLKRLRELDGRKVIVAGCLPAAQPNLLSDFKILGTITPRSIHRIRRDVYTALDGAIGLVTISEGCVGRCSFCIVKQARGDLESYPPEMIVNAVRKLVDGGAKEIRITSQDTAAYGLDIGVRLPALIDDITSLDGDFKIRIGMMNPATTKDILDDLIESFDSPKVFKFLHLPIQSGSDAILQSMNRGHSVADFVEIVDAFRQRFPELTLSTDFIVGYPGETGEDFDASIRILRKTNPTKVNITRFSPRPGTPAAELPDIIGRVKKERSRELTKVHHAIVYQLHKRWIGRIVEALVTEKGKNNTVVARDASYKNIVIKEDLPLGSRCRVKITDARPTYLIGTIDE